MATLAEMKPGESYEELVRYEGFAAGLSNAHGLVLILTTLFSGAQQRETMQKDPMDLRLLQADNLLLFLARLPGFNWMDAPLAISRELLESQTLTLPYRPEKGRVPYTVLLSDGATGELVSKREGLLSAAASARLLKALEAVEMNPDQAPTLEALNERYTEWAKQQTSEDWAKQARVNYKLPA